MRRTALEAALPLFAKESLDNIGTWRRRVEVNWRWSPIQPHTAPKSPLSVMASQPVLDAEPNAKSGSAMHLWRPRACHELRAGYRRPTGGSLSKAPTGVVIVRSRFEVRGSRIEAD